MSDRDFSHYVPTSEHGSSGNGDLTVSEQFRAYSTRSGDALDCALILSGDVWCVGDDGQWHRENAEEGTDR